MNRPDVSITLEVTNDCESLLLTDDTGTYNSVTNPEGYGLTGGPAVNDVTGVEIVLTYDTQETSITYNFTVASGVITAATLGVEDETPTDILSELVSTTWPLTDFDLVLDYGVTIPTFELGVHSVDYTITGTYNSSSFSFTTSKSILNECSANCCIQKMFAEIDVNCGCASEAIDKANRAKGYLMAARYGAQSGKTDEAVKALNKANELCEGGCGCN
jgi:hypothetical protein